MSALSALEIIEGVGGGRFAPDKPITRAEFTAIAMRFTSRTAGEGPAFSDVPQVHWAYKYINGAAWYGWVNGYQGGRFMPQANITRAEAAKIVNAMLGRVPDANFIKSYSTLIRQFSDVAADHWASAQIIEATNAHTHTVKDGVESWGDLT